MISERWRALAVAALAVVTLGADLVLSPAWQAVVLGAACACVALPWVWPRTEDEHARSRVATLACTLFAGFGAGFYASLLIGAAALAVAMTAAIAGGFAVRTRARLAGAALPTEGEPSGRVVFEGRACSIGEPERVPGTDLPVVVWVARQVLRRWASTTRFELRGDDHRVLVDPGRMRLGGSPWRRYGTSGRASAAALDRATRDRVIRVWSVHEDNRVYIVGRAALADDAAAPTLRDPGRVYVFGGDATIGFGVLRYARRAAQQRIAIAAVVAILAGAVAVVNRLGLIR